MGVENEITRIDIGGVIFYANVALASRLAQLVGSTQISSTQNVDKEQWSEIAAGLLLERMKNVSRDTELTIEDLDYLTNYLNRHLTLRSANPAGRSVSGLISPLMLVCTFLL